jgi:hypothetical protein
MSNLPPLPTRPGPLPELPHGRGEGSRFGVVVATAVVTCVVVLGAAYVFVEHHARPADPPLRMDTSAPTTTTRPAVTPTTMPHRPDPTTTTTLTPTTRTTFPSVNTTTTVSPTTTTLPSTTRTSVSPVRHHIEVYVRAAASGDDAVEVSVVVQTDAPVVAVTLYGSGPTGTTQRSFTVRPVQGVATYEASFSTQLPFTVYAGVSSSAGLAISRTETVE